MTKDPKISRRLLLAGLWLAGSGSASAQTRGTDQGIGGTGITRGDDHGIGGTGIVGVIRRFGSIFVNGQRIAYAPDVPVRIDGEAASAKALRIGHLARVLAQRQGDGWLATRGIDVVSEVIGPIETVNSEGMTVLGQKVTWAGRESWRRSGAHVAVFGLRRTDGAIVASLVEPRRGALARVAGPLEGGRGTLRIGGLRIEGVDPALVGRRVEVEGRIVQGVMHVTRATPDDFSDLPGAGRMLIEAYVRRDAGTNLQVGSGYAARDASLFPTTNGSEEHVVLNAVFDRSRGLEVESVQHVNSFPGGPAGGPGLPGSPPGPGGPTSLGGSPNSPGGRPGAAMPSDTGPAGPGGLSTPGPGGPPGSDGGRPGGAAGRGGFGFPGPGGGGGGPGGRR